MEPMRIDKNKPTLAQAVHRTVQYLENIHCGYIIWYKKVAVCQAL